MLYDPKWEVKTKSDVFSREGLIAWLEKQPADGVYCYQDTGHCLLGQYFKASGFSYVVVGGTEITLDKGEHHLPEDFQNIALRHPRTFGAALTRARKAHAQ